MIRISTAAASDQLIGHVLETQSRLHDAQVRVSTEKVSQDYAGLGAQSRVLLAFENQRDLQQGFLDRNAILETRLSVAQSSVSGVRDALESFQSRLEDYAAGSSTSEEEMAAIQEAAFATLQTLEGMINVEVAGEYLFSGARSDQAPVETGFGTLSEFQAVHDGLTPGDTITAEDYYQGDGLTKTYRLDASLSLDFDVQASDPAFEAAFEALSLIAQGGDFGTAGALDRNPTRVDEALELLDQAISGLQGIQTDLGFGQARVEEVNGRLETSVASLDVMVIGIENVDSLEAVVELEDLANALEASYQALARISGLSLTKYM